jgi:uncharacterized metal-binding protein YceD (DUF177 family)
MKTNTIRGSKPPFSYLVKVGHISVNPVTVHLEANERELEGLTKLWQVSAVRSLSAELQVNRWKKDGVRIKGRVRAEITQACVVTLDPIDSVIDEHVEQIFVPEGSKLARMTTGEAAELVVDPDGPDLPELFEGDAIDVGDAVAEFAALAIDPYPRKQGIEFADHVESSAEDKNERPNPFAVLKDWKKD